MSRATIGFIGGGQMARALARGVVRADLAQATEILMADPAAAAREDFLGVVSGARVIGSNRTLVEQSETVVLATKPQSFSQVAAEIAEVASADVLFVSIMAGVSLLRLTAGLGTDRLIRVMPNTPCLIGCGASAYAAGTGASPQDAERIGKLLSAVGLAFLVDEALLDAVTGLSGSGPAYVYTMIEALSDGGVRMGLPREQATALAAQTVLGAARMVVETGTHPSVLRDRVTSPAGTTIAGLQVLERHGLRSALIDAVESATVRSRELGEQ
jgi:pyrroline-5-carboxylate reductase